MKLVLVRHGESLWNKENLFTGWTDVDLSSTGILEAREAGKTLKEQGFDFDVCYTSYLKRAIHTLDNILDVMDRTWLPVIKNWRLNEKHYGVLQGFNKADTAKKYGETQVKLWRRSYDTRPPALELDDPRNPRNLAMYRNEKNKDELPLTECLKDTVARSVPYFNDVIKKDMLEGKRVLLVAHGNSLRSLVKYFDNATDEEIIDVNIPTGVPLVYEFDKDFKVVKKYYLADEKALKEKMNSVANQGKAK